LGLDLAVQRGGASAHLAGLQGAFERVPDQMAEVLTRQNAAVEDVAALEARRSFYLYAGGGPGYACALFGAAKVKECSPDYGLAIPLEEYHHYNSQKAGDPLFLVAPTGRSLARALDTAREGKRWGGQVYSLVSGADATLVPHSDRVFRLPAVPEFLVPFVYTIPLQQFAYHVAMAKFGLAKAKLG
jgi:glutamine---fructose-6-phosphate transaminase (isomerizing)